MNIRPQMITERQAAEPSYSKWQPTPQALADMRKRYGDAQSFLSIFTPDLQIAAARHPERTYTGTAPTLATIAVGYGEPVAIVWICIQLENVNLFAGVKEKMPVQPPKRAVGLDSHRVSIFKSLRDAPVLPPAEMRAVRTLLRIGGCLDHHHLAPAIHGRATERERPLPATGHGSSRHDHPILEWYHV